MHNANYGNIGNAETKQKTEETAAMNHQEKMSPFVEQMLASWGTSAQTRTFSFARLTMTSLNLVSTLVTWQDVSFARIRVIQAVFAEVLYAAHHAVVHLLLLHICSVSKYRHQFIKNVGNHPSTSHTSPSHPFTPSPSNTVPVGQT